MSNDKDNYKIFSLFGPDDMLQLNKRLSQLYVHTLRMALREIGD